MEIGQRVRVFRLRDRVSRDVVDRLGKTGTIQEFKMLDGSNVGAVVAFDEDSFATWFFEDELQPI